MYDISSLRVNLLVKIFPELCEMKFRFRIHKNPVDILSPNPNRMKPGNEIPGHIFPFFMSCQINTARSIPCATFHYLTPSVVRPEKFRGFKSCLYCSIPEDFRAAFSAHYGHARNIPGPILFMLKWFICWMKDNSIFPISL